MSVQSYLKRHHYVYTTHGLHLRENGNCLIWFWATSDFRKTLFHLNSRTTCQILMKFGNDVQHEENLLIWFWTQLGLWDPYLLIFSVPPKFIKPNQKCKAEYRVGRRVITLGSMRFEFVASTFVSLHMLDVLWTMSYSSTLFLAWSWIYMLCYIVCLMADLTTRVRHCQGFSLTFDLHRS